MSAETLRRAAALMRSRAEAATDVWGVPTWRASLSELGDHEGYRELPAYMQTHVATNDVHGSVILASPWTDQAPTIHAASWHPVVALAVADWLDEQARAFDAYMDKQMDPTRRFNSLWLARAQQEHAHALTVAQTYLGSNE